MSTGSPRWGYDPYAGAYYDYNRRCYYDPYLYGYYPVGYRPRYVYGSPHPHGWRSGGSYIAPPTTIRSYNLTNYENRTSRYQSLGRDWSRNVRTSPDGRDQHGYNGRGRSREDFTPSPDRSSRIESSGSGGFNRGNRGNGAPFGGGNTAVGVPPQAPFERGEEGSRRSRPSFDSDRRQAFADRVNEARQQGGNRGGRQMAPAPQQSPPEPQFQPPPEPQREAPQNDEGGRGRGEFRGGGGGAPTGDEGGGRGRGVRGLGEG